MKQMIRPRRLRSSESVRELVAENNVRGSDLIFPIFLLSDENGEEPISSMPGQYRWGINVLDKKLKPLVEKGLRSICLFPVVPENLKDKTGSYSFDSDNFYLRAISRLKEAYPELSLMTDVALDPYSTDGHDGILDDKTGEILNDETLEILAKMSLAQAKAGADIIGPSDMMDGRVFRIREVLESEGFSNTLIMSYTAKYASNFYGPFREALDSAPKSGDKKTYQMDYRNSSEALKEAFLDVEEGSDILMVKPGLPYLDVVQLLAQNISLPISVYQVSGEYSMIKFGVEKGFFKEREVVMETLTSFKRAGASIILSYFTPFVLDWLKES